MKTKTKKKLKRMIRKKLKSKSKIMRPLAKIAGTVVGKDDAETIEVEGKVLGVLRPTLDTKDFMFSMEGEKVTEVARDYTLLFEEHAKQEDAAWELKKRLHKLGEWLCEQMAKDDIQSMKVGNRTIYRKKKFVASKAAGIETESVLEVLRSIGWGEMISEGYTAQTLKASIKERRLAAIESGNMGEKWYCVDCLEYRDLGPVPTHSPAIERFIPPCPTCYAELQCTLDGIPKMLASMMYVNESFVLGCLKSN